MNKNRKNHITYWTDLATALDRGTPLLPALQQIAAKLEGAPLAKATEAMARSIEAGQALSEAMSAHDAVFCPWVTTMVRAGEAGGVLEVITKRIAEGIRDGSFPLPGETTDSKDDPARFWRAFGRLLSSGVPILQTLDLVGQIVSDRELCAAARSLHDAVMDGKDMASALRTLSSVIPEQICQAIEQGEQQGTLPEQAFRIAEALECGDLSSLVPSPAEVGTAEPGVKEAAIVQAVNRILVEAFKSRASDIHIDSTEDGKGRVRIRVDGVLRELDADIEGRIPNVISRIKLMASMNIAERRLPQDGRIMLSIEGRSLDFRVCLAPTVFGERVVMRILDREQVVLDLARIGLEGDDLEKIRELCSLPNGVIVATGPTGCGKTTLLYAMLAEVTKPGVCVMSVEDPVEYTLDGVAQIQIKPAIGLTFPRALRTVMRQDPDVIMVGEMRDLESLQCAVQVSFTGHLLMTTMHANTAVGAIRRLIDVGIEPFLVNASLAGVVAQRLVRQLCPECKRPAEPERHMMPPEAPELLNNMGKQTFYAAVGCEHCRGTGFRGRTAIHEIMVVNDEIRRKVADGDMAGVGTAARAAGMKALLQSGLEKAAQGITTVEEVLRLRVVPRAADL